MLSYFNTKSTLLPSCELPFTIISLNQWKLITINGIDSVKYLQGQLTVDVTSINSNKYIFAAHCNEKGKMYSSIYLCYHLDQLTFIIRYSVCANSLAALNKYAIFSKVTVTSNDDAVILGVAGFKAEEVLREFFSLLPNILYPVVHNQDTTIMYISKPKPRFLLITTNIVRNQLLDTLINKVHITNNAQWLALDIEAGYPIIDNATSMRLLPQAVNLELLGGINFTKGCYVGQEAIARAKYRGLNQQKLYFLVGQAHDIPITGEPLEIKVGNYWRDTGIVLAACQMQHQNIWVQAVLNNHLEIDNIFRVSKDLSSYLKIYPLSY